MEIFKLLIVLLHFSYEIVQVAGLFVNLFKYVFYASNKHCIKLMLSVQYNKHFMFSSNNHPMRRNYNISGTSIAQKNTSSNQFSSSCPRKVYRKISNK